ncbi:MAG TPA: HigA family addiction module antitoxin [Cellvibrio sp.]|nr:HigA family addiction module antitoxin [Cellvibrio sp.]
MAVVTVTLRSNRAARICPLFSRGAISFRSIHPSAFNRSVNAKAGISPIMALKLSKVLGRSPESWLAMQRNFDLWAAKLKTDLSGCESIKF